MKKLTIAIMLVLIISTQAQQFLQLGKGLQLQSLTELHDLDPDTISCSPDLLQITQSIDAWSEILENQSQLDADTESLEQLQFALKDFRQSSHHQVLLQTRQHYHNVMAQLDQETDLTLYQTWRKEGSNLLQSELNLLDQAQNKNDADQCCDRIEKLIDRLLKEREEIKKQCQTPSITINVINSKSTKIHQTNESCSGQGVTINFKKTEGAQSEADEVSDAPESVGDEKIKEPSESSSDSEDEEDKDQDLDKKKREADSSNPEPVVDQEATDEKEDFKEYGYGFWAKFLLGYPKRLPQGKNAPWYFVSRLTSNKKNDNAEMGDRLLAIWLGKGYYHYTTCDSSKNQPNVVQNINYPEDIDGVWTYIYYSYSVEQKKAVGFIKFGEDDVKKIVHTVTNPLTKFLKFTIGGTDGARYPGFNGLINQIYFSAKVGVFIDSEEELTGKLQSQKKQMKFFLPETYTYKLVSNPITREPNTNDIHQIIGAAKNPKIPHEYSFSGWFKWTQPKQQEEWHNAFRVQIATPSTDKFLGDRTLSMWVGKSDGIIHLPTYTYNNMEGDGNANLFKNIPHKDRHTKWFFVYFGYSKPEREAFAYIKWSDSEDSQDYEKVNHFSVPRFYVFVGKDKHFPGFSGQIALAVFNIGEGSFRKSSDYKAKNDIFQFGAGVKKLTGKQSDDEPEKHQETDDGVTRTSSSEEPKPVIEQSEDSEDNFKEYGYGFWMRFLTVYPVRMINGKNAPWYFVARLTSNKNYENIGMGDRLLAIWQGQGYYHYTTCDSVKNQVNLIQNINYPVDIEGVWTYIYYSYSVEDKKAVGFAKYGNEEPRAILHAVQHPTTKYLKFLLGGKDQNRYPGFNGLFSQVDFSAKDGAFIDTTEELNSFIARTMIPKQDLDKLFRHELVDGVISRKTEDLPDYDEVGGNNQKFPHEYAFSGWFKWESVQQKQWHNIFRVQINKPSTDRYLGDRTLSCWLGQSQGGILHFPTYTYTNMNGAGNPNVVRNIVHKNRHLEWSFIYYGYSKNDKKAFVTVKFSTGIETIEYNNVNHYYSPKFYIFTGKDKQFPGFNGKLGYVNFVLGDGAFRKTPDFKHPLDVFGLTEGEVNLFKKPQPKVEPTVDPETGEKHIPSAVNNNKPLVEKDDSSEANLTEYGYGFWARYLTAYPVRMISGKNAPWYFVSRMTSNKNYGNVAMGDRILAIWQGQGFYHFTTCDSSKNQVNVVKNINYPADIEGLWTYFYYSYSVAEKKAVAFITYGETQTLNIEHAVTHPLTQYMKFVLGGKDQNRYPAFNGQIASVVHSLKPGAFIGTLDQFKNFLAKQPSPLGGKSLLKTNKILDSEINRQPNSPSASQNVDASFPKEYAISGWFKWVQPTPQQSWHNLYRVQINTPSTDKFLGDRTLAMWVGTAAGGILHSTTYTYTNMNGGGNPNTPQNILHKNRHLEWFFVYQGYSKTTKEAYTYVKWTTGEDSIEFKNVNHYFASKYVVFVGKDIQFPGFSGKVAFVSFNTGEGASKKGNDFTHPTDVFRFDKGKQNLFPKVDPSKPTVDERGEIPNEVNNNSPKVDKSLVDTENLVEYGYGFWARFLTAYPVRMLAGKNAPWYFVSRLTVNQEYDNIRMGDRTLAIWQGQGYYHFTTCNSANGQVNVIQNINYPADIEGLWTYVYYSYSVEKKKAVAFIKFGDDEPKSITHQVTHPTTKQVRFVLGGMDENRYPAFNGLFSKVVYSQKKGAFIDSVNQLKDLHGAIPESIVQLANNKVVAGVVERAPTVAPVYSVIGDDKTKLPTEYAISGWFNWDLTKQEVWHNVFRVQINTPSTDKYLGDRTLSCWVGTPAGGILHFPTYTYSNMNGAGNANVVQNIVHKNRINNWFFVYYGYSKTEKHAYVYVKFTDSEESLNYANTNHYFAPKFYVFVGKDAQFPGFSGKVAYVNFNVGKNSFKKGNDFTDDGDNFGFSLGVKELFKPVKPDELPAPDTSVHESKTSEPNPKVDKTGKDDDELKEYGYGFWMRFLTAYPERLLSGKNQPWYFVARLTIHQEYDNIRMGDRTLAIWQGQGYYHFTTCNAANGQVNVIQNINYPDDIEGVWTYVYYSYSVKEQSAIAFVKYGDDEFKTITHKVVHPGTKQVRFILGGNDEKRYPAFNGLFTNVYFNSKVGAFIGSMPTVKKFMEDNGGVPSTKLGGLITKPIVTDEITRSVPDAPIQVTVAEKKLPQEYAISGWFRWKTVAPQQAWHNVFRVQIKAPSTDQFLGDRTLTCWVGTPEGGILHFPTYTYTNMNGGGNSNYYKNIKHEDRHNQWFFVYFGYSKPAAQAFVYVKWSKTENNLEYPNANHYLASEFFIYLGKDTHFPGFNGKIANVQFNAGEGAFKKGNDFTDPKDVFGFKAGFDKFGKDEPEPTKEEPKKEEPKPEPKKEEPKPIEIQPEKQDSKPEEKKPEIQTQQIDPKMLENKSSSKAPVVDKEGSGDDNLTSYGYGFWMRFLTVYPERLLAGKNQPWYFVSRLTWNKEYDNVRMGDRTLAIWQGQGYYHFTSCNVANGNVNVIQNINYPADIEGVWTYVYYSYTNEKKAVAFIKYGADEPQSITHDVTHQPTKSVRFILGGNDEARYPGFNGLFTSVTFATQNAFIGTVDQFKTFLTKVGVPSIDVKELTNTNLVDKEVSRTPNDEPTKYAVVGEDGQRFPHEYAISGWFKWKPTAQQPWHNLFRVQIKTPSTDNFLGDRTLTLWLGTPEGGILHFPTYTYTNMNGAGNANHLQNIAHKNRHLEWFFVYFGYSKTAAKAYAYVKWSDSEDSLTYPNTNHYLTPEFFVFVGRDKQFPGHSGKLGYVNFNVGEGAFSTNNKYGEQPKDVFGFKGGVDNLFKKDDKIEPGESIKDLLPNGFEQKKPVVEKEVEGDQNLEEYGYGFWMRYLTAYPQRLLSGKNQPWYFVARLTQHKEYDNVRMGDRTLAVWQGQGYYHFTTCNSINNNPNMIQNIDYPADIEGVWTYVYYSYSDDKSRAVGFIKYADGEIKQIKHEVSHPSTKFVRFILGGNDEGRYPGFNGLFTYVTFGAQKGVFIDTVDQLKSYIEKQDGKVIPVPLVNTPMVDSQISREVAADPIYKVVGDEKQMFPTEYAISGWFKWQPVVQQPWHNIFRVQIKTPSTDNFLGDRTLTCWLGTPEGGILHFPTYTYSNMVGAGNANYYKNIPHKERHNQWFFVYFGYSKPTSTAYAYVKWSDSEDSNTYDNANHYYAPEFFVFVGKDKHFPGFNGKIAYVSFNAGEGSFKKGTDFTHDKDTFGFNAGIEKLVKKPATEFKPSEPEKGALESAFNAAKPTIEKEASSEQALEEYGYGFWMRFLTVYPQRLLAGKNEAWYFLARLTQHKEYDNIRMGDRTLAIWQGQGYYHFTTCNSATNNVNQIQNINYPADIEGLWTYVYYSYSVDENQAVAFIKYGDTEIQTITHKTTHPITKFVRFILGGTDEKRYPGFNGQFSQVTFSAASGAYVGKVGVLQQYLDKHPAPSTSVALSNELLVKDKLTRAVNDEPILKTVGGEGKSFPWEYAMSGWFKWLDVQQQPWHNIFRVTIKNPSTDQFLGDRTLTCWLGNGILHFPTYTYTNMNGAGNANHHQNIDHKNRHFKWFYIYFGYSKKDTTAYIYVKWNDSDDSLTYEKINHYFTPEFFVYVGKDKHFPGFNGQIGQVNFNLGTGSFLKGKDYKDDKNIFGFDAPFAKKTVQPFDLKEIEQKVLVSAQDQKVPTLEKTFAGEDVEDITEYGYGFWCRFLTHYPQQLKTGLNVDWSFMARLTKNQQLADIGLGDRTLALWQGKGYYHFTTYTGGNPNAINNVNYGDIEGVWTFIYHSHSLDKKQTIAFVKFGAEKIIKVVQAAEHKPPTFLKFYLGGINLSYKGFNGQFQDVFVSVNAGIFKDNEDAITKLLETTKQPDPFNTKLITKTVIETDQVFNDKYEIKENVYEDMPLVGEYAWSGWFKWTTCAQQPWHLAVRLSILQSSENIQFLGDRTLNLWIGNFQGGIMHFATYSYANIFGGGNVNSVQNILYKNDLPKWHFVYFGYSKAEKMAYAKVEFKSRTEELIYKDHNHFLPNKFSIYMGRDKWHAIYSGQISYFKFNGGPGAFLKDGYDKATDDVFGYGSGKGTLIKPPVKFDLDKSTEKKVINSPQDQKEAILIRKVEGAELDDVEEYGYGFWCRFLTHYPKQLSTGLQPAWSFMARVTQNEKLADAGVGDRTLALWLGKGYYHFTTYSAGNPNVINNVNHPADIEGLWTFIYHSHHLDKKQSIHFVKFGDEKIIKNVVAADHTNPSFLQFYLGGNNMNYPAYNGQFSGVIFSTNLGVFLNEEAQIEKLIEQVKRPDQFNAKLTTQVIFDKIETFKPEIAVKENQFDQFALVGEYAWSGWFKWTPCAQQPWHLMVRLAILQASENLQFLGDRTLTAWVGQGYFHATSYSYANMYGGGNVNQWQNMPYESDHVKWHFIYFGYSKVQKLSYFRVEFQGRLGELKFKDTNHYLPNVFSFYAAKDKWHSTYSGQISYLRFNGGPGAFTENEHEKADGDIFGYKAGKAAFPMPTEPEVDELRKQEVLDSAVNGKYSYEQELKKEQLENLEEFGYGFYIRYLSQYPVQMRVGKTAPWYRIARLSKTDKYGDGGVGDRILANWMGIDGYSFVSCISGGAPYTMVPYPQVEGQWTLLYFSYSVTKQTAVGILKFDDVAEIKHTEIKIAHQAIDYLKFTLGGADQYHPGFNGQIANYVLKTGPGAFISHYDFGKKYLDNRVPHPLADNTNLRFVDILTDEKTYKGDSQEDVTKVITEESLFADEYSISTWVRWDPSPVVQWSNVFRLTKYSEELNDLSKLGDRDMALYMHNGLKEYRFHYYTYTNLHGGGNWSPGWTSQFGDQDKFWHFVYFGFSRKESTMYTYAKYVEIEHEFAAKNINHFLVGKHYLSFGKDYKKFYASYRGLNGVANLARVAYGRGAFRMKPLGAQGDKPDIFWFDKGNQIYIPKFDQKLVKSEDGALLAAEYNAAKPLIDWNIEEGKDDMKIRGLSEYGWAMWCRWSRTSPINLPLRVPWHTLARLTNQRNHKDLSVQGDRTLAAWVGWGFYYFSAYTQGVLEKVERINYKQIDGEWNFVTFNYKKGQAKGIVVFDGKDAQEIKMDVQQSLINDYLHFIVGKEFGYQFFNGHYYNVQLRLGDGSFLDKDGALTLANGQMELPQKLRYDQTRKSIVIQKEKAKVLFDQKATEVIIKPEDAQGKDEYSISGWARFVDPASIAAFHLLYRVTIYTEEELQDMSKPGDRTLNCWKASSGVFHITGYTVDELNGGNWNQWKNVDYQGTLHKNWVYFYHGYSKTQQKMHAYFKFPSSEVHLDWDKTNQFVPNYFRVQLHKDKFYAGYNGQVESWYFNVGKGSYKEKDYGAEETEFQNFGFGGLTKNEIKPWSFDNTFDTVWNIDRTVGQEVTFEDDSLSGITEYGYGMWTRFVWNGKEKLIDKPAWMALSRLSLNANYEGDARAVGDRALAIWVGAGYYHFTTSSIGVVNVIQNINYDQMLDGQWNYIYFGYKKLPAGGKVVGHVLFNGLAARSTAFPVINHPPIIDYLYFAAGSSGAKLLKNYHSFNGQIAKVKVHLGDGSFFESADELRKLIPKIPALPELKSIKETILEEAIDMKREETTVDPKEYQTEFDGAQEYSVSLWYKWSPLARVPWEQMYTLSYNEPKLRANHVRAGDRVLSLYQYADHRTFFSTYTTPNTHDAFAQIYNECPVPAPDQAVWVYAYYGYSRSQLSVNSFLKTRSTECEKKLPAMHRVPRYLGLYVGKDAMHTPFNGKFAHMYLYAGAGAYIDKEYLSFAPYIAGATGLSSKPYLWAENKKPFEQAFDQTTKTEFDAIKIEGHSTYGYGLWTRYLTAIPKRLLNKPNWLSIARFTVNKDHKDLASVGDRTLACWVGTGYYTFATYDLTKNNPNVYKSENYNDNLEGSWNFIYFAYSSVKSQATAFIKFGITGDVKRIPIEGIQHRPIQDYAALVIGKEFVYQSFNGQIAQLQVMFGAAAYIHDVDSLETQIKNNFQQPELNEPGAVTLKIQEEEKIKTVKDEPQQTEWPTQYQEALEYSIFGWFRYSSPTLATNNNIFLRLTNNEKEYRKEYQTVGDRTLIIMLQQKEVVFSTYTMGKIDSGADSNLRKAINYNNNLGVWTYVWFGYNWHKKVASGIVKFPTENVIVPYENVLHMVPKYLALFAGSDGMLGGWVGPMQKVGAIFGKGAYVDPNKGNYLNQLPNIQPVDQETIEWETEGNDVISVPKDDKPAIDQTFKEKVNGINEYGYGLWTRWLMTTPSRVWEKSPFHQLVRLTNTEKYEDNQQLGNRVLATWVGKGYYHFTTYDKATNKNSINQNANYGDYLEGHWNYVYFSYSPKDSGKAVGFVKFGDLEGDNVERIEIVGIQHMPLNGYARVVVSSKEFGYPQFNGMIKDFKLFLGKGFIGSKEQFLQEIIKNYPKPQVKVPVRTDINVLNENKQINKGMEILKKQYDQYQGVLEYAVSGWIQSSKGVDAIRTIFRLTINAPDFLKDDKNAGDRTLAAFQTKDQYVFATYDYGDLDTNDDDQNDLNKGLDIKENQAEWTYLYFGYDLKSRKAFCYTFYKNREDSYLFKDLKHFVPNQFWFYLGGDAFKQQYEGNMFDWNLRFGDGAFTLKPKEFIKNLPYDSADEVEKVMSALLGNQGLSSVKLIKNLPMSATVDQASGPQSGNANQVDGAKSGKTENAQGPLSGDQSKLPGAESGNPEKGKEAKSGQ